MTSLWLCLCGLIGTLIIVLLVSVSGLVVVLFGLKVVVRCSACVISVWSVSGSVNSV